MVTECECIPAPQSSTPVPTIELSEPTPETEKRYKCHTCHEFFYERFLVIINDVKHCPVCGETHLVDMCKHDGNHCPHDTMAGIAYCPECNQPVCPECLKEHQFGGRKGFSHDVVQISRVTGYLQDVSGWNASKQQELKDRVRFNLPSPA